MNGTEEHDEIREQVALLAAGALDAESEARVVLHAATCPECAAEIERWRVISGGLRRLPTPQPSPQLFERTRAMVAAQLEARAEQRQNQIVLVLLIFFSWAVTLVSWPVFHIATSGLFSLLDIRFREAWLLFAMFSGLTWLAGGSAAVLLSARRQHERRLAL